MAVLFALVYSIPRLLFGEDAAGRTLDFFVAIEDRLGGFLYIIIAIAALLLLAWLGIVN